MPIIILSVREQRVFWINFGYSSAPPAPFDSSPPGQFPWISTPFVIPSIRKSFILPFADKLKFGDF